MAGNVIVLVFVLRPAGVDRPVTGQKPACCPGMTRKRYYRKTPQAVC